MTATTNETIQNYFKAIHQGGWEDYIAEGFKFSFTNLDKVETGKASYIAGAKQFFSMTTAVEIKQIIVENTQASVIARYQIQSPTGKTMATDVAEIFSVKDGLITSSILFHDTKAFAEFMAS